MGWHAYLLLLWDKIIQISGSTCRTPTNQGLFDWIQALVLCEISAMVHVVGIIVHVINGSMYVRLHVLHVYAYVYGEQFSEERWELAVNCSLIWTFDQRLQYPNHLVL